MIRRLGQLDDNATKAEQSMSLRKPQLALPVEANSLTLFLQLGPLKCSALPKSTRHRTEDCVLCALQKDPPAWAYDS
jgi:hypothetical protein